MRGIDKITEITNSVQQFEYDLWQYNAPVINFLTSCLLRTGRILTIYSVDS